MEALAAHVAGELLRHAVPGVIEIYNHSDQLIEARIDADGFDKLTGNKSCFKIHVGSSERWSRTRQQIVRIHAYSLWHDFKLSPGAVVKFTLDHKLQIVDGNHMFSWDATKDGPHL